MLSDVRRGNASARTASRSRSAGWLETFRVRQAGMDTVQSIDLDALTAA
jgi:hypothetical protein